MTTLTKTFTLEEEMTFKNATESYSLYLEDWRDTAQELREAQSKASEIRRETEMREAELRLDPSIDGKNNEIRGAQLLALCRQDAAYQAAQKTVDELKTRITALQDQATEQRDRLSLHKRVMDWCIVYTKFLAQEGGENNGAH